MLLNCRFLSLERETVNQLKNDNAIKFTSCLRNAKKPACIQITLLGVENEKRYFFSQYIVLLHVHTKNRAEQPGGETEEEKKVVRLFCVLPSNPDNFVVTLLTRSRSTRRAFFSRTVQYGLD